MLLPFPERSGVCSGKQRSHLQAVFSPLLHVTRFAGESLVEGQSEAQSQRGSVIIGD